MNERTENIRYSLLVSLNIMMLCDGFGYITYYLLDANVSDKDIGIVLALSCAAAVVLQQISGRLTDSGAVGGKILLILMSAVMSVLAFALLFVDGGLTKSLLFGLLTCLTLAMQPVINSFTFFYKAKNISVNYGIARGCGSLSFAVASGIVGFLTVKFGSIVVSSSYLIFCLAFLATAFFMPEISGRSSSEKTGSNLNLSKFPAFRLMLIGLSLIMIFHNMLMAYFIRVIELVGGNSEDLGFALGIAAMTEIPVLFLYTRIKGQTSSKIFLAVSGVAFFARAFLIVFAQSVFEIYLIQCIQFFSYGLLAAARVYYVDEVVGKKYETTGQAYMTATETLGMVFGSVLGGFLIHVGNVNVMTGAGAIICFVGMILVLQSAFKFAK